MNGVPDRWRVSRTERVGRSRLTWTEQEPFLAVYERWDRVGAMANPTRLSLPNGHEHVPLVATLACGPAPSSSRDSTPPPGQGLSASALEHADWKAYIPSLYVVVRAARRSSSPTTGPGSAQRLHERTGHRERRGELLGRGTRCNVSHRDARGVPCPRPDPLRERGEGDGAHRDPRIRVPGRGCRPQFRRWDPGHRPPAGWNVRGVLPGVIGSLTRARALRTNACTSRSRMRSD
jgi:hypothetical protein